MIHGRGPRARRRGPRPEIAYPRAVPLFGRPDGDLVRDLPAVRRIMPYLMRGRNESAVYQKTLYDLGRALPWLERYGEAHERKATLFHLFLFAVARALHERPGLNRFVSGGRVWQRRGVWLSFAAKKAFADDAPIVTVKVEMPREQTFSEAVARLTDAVSVGRSGARSRVDKELSLALALPGPMLRWTFGLMRWLDRWNLLPGGVIASDPMYASAFFANLGSVGIGDTYHHLYEYGTVGVFGVLGKIGKKPFCSEDGAVDVRDGVEVGWTLDERIADGFYCAASLAIAQRILEDPEAHLGAPDAA